MRLQRKILRMWYRFWYGTWKDRWYRCVNSNCRWLYALDGCISRKSLETGGWSLSGKTPCGCQGCIRVDSVFRPGNYLRFDGLKTQKIVGSPRWHRGLRWWSTYMWKLK